MSILNTGLPRRNVTGVSIPPGTLEAHQICSLLRARGWTYSPKRAPHAWRKGFHIAGSAEEAFAHERREDAFTERWRIK